MEHDIYQIGEKFISQDEVNKAVQEVINSLKESHKTYGIAKFILEKSIEKLDEICTIKSF